MSLRHDVIPANIRAAAKRAGLGLPDWYIGPRQNPNYKRKKTLADLAQEAREAEAERSERGRSDD